VPLKSTEDRETRQLDCRFILRNALLQRYEDDGLSLSGFEEYPAEEHSD
jgi:hypothetical protein